MYGTSFFARSLLISLSAHAVVFIEARDLLARFPIGGNRDAKVIRVSWESSQSTLGETKATNLIEEGLEKPPEELRAISREGVIQKEVQPKSISRKVGSSKKEMTVSKLIQPVPHPVLGNSEERAQGLTNGASLQEGMLQGDAPIDAKLIGITPQYPRFARQQGQEGRVVYKVSVTPEGRSGKIELQKSSGFSLLDNAALTALNEATFEGSQAKRGSNTLVAFTFRIEER